MKKKLIIFFIFLGIVKGYSQCQGNSWVLGDSVCLKFDCLTNQPSIEEISIWHLEENYTSISDSNGNLIMYLNGPDSMIIGANFQFYCNLYNGLGLEIENGDSINTNFSVYNSLILPYPNHNNVYYFFYTQEKFYNNLIPGLYCSIIDMNLNSGLGKVILKNQLLITDTLMEGISAVKHGNGRDWWVTSHGGLSNKFYEFLLSPSGVNFNSEFDIGPNFPVSGVIKIGEILFNNKGNKLALSSFDFNGVFIFDFNRCSGLISNPSNYSSDLSEEYSVTFSPNDSFIYTSDYGHIYQIDLFNSNLNNRILIWQNTTAPYTFLGQGELGPDGKIYYASQFFSPYIYESLNYFDSSNTSLSIINYPNISGTSCGFYPYSLYLNGHRSKGGLPDMPNYNLSALDESECDSLGLGIDNGKLIIDNVIVRIYPNPSSDELTIEILNGVKPKEIEIVNALGVTVVKLKQTKPNQQVNIKSLAAGVYFIKVQMQNGDMQVKKFVKSE